jgi:hypothetical protein
MFVFATAREAYAAAGLLFPNPTRTTRVAIADRQYIKNASYNAGVITLAEPL